MATMTLTSKGQATIPKMCRDRLGLKPGDRLDVTVEPDGSLRVVPARGDIRAAKGFLHRPGRRRVSVKAMNLAIAKAAARS